LSSGARKGELTRLSGPRFPAQKYTLKPKKKLGQHFLKETKIIEQILACANFERSSHVLEIGPGLGALTLPLAKRVQHVFAVEKDQDLARAMKKKIEAAGIDNVTIIAEDILKFSFNELETEKNLYVIGNLPYNISSPFLEKLIQNRHHVIRAVLTFQLEFAKRLVAGPGSREYGALSVLVRYHALVSPLIEIPKEAFFPRPKVGSMVVELDFTKPYPVKGGTEQNFRRIVRAAFSSRRKILANSLKGSFPSLSPDYIVKCLVDCGINPRDRAERLDIDDFLRLSTVLTDPVLDKREPQC